MVLAGWLSNPTPPPLERAIRAYRNLDLSCATPVTTQRRQAKRAIQLGADQVARLVDSYQSGATVYELAAQFGIDRRTVSAHLKRQGIATRFQSPTEQDIDQMIRLYRTGLSMAAVGRQLGFAPRTVQRHIKARGVRARDTHGRDVSSA
ncbi:hypothetical protein [Nocardioides zeae]|uniref:hypothetical protein n=1 Tax=Nocardioides zeae TaxID=1457234 RepID=UPI0027D7B705|nr:hypothetical protein [Nocardioides zeae]